MHGGLPSPDLFPIQGLSLDCVVPETADEHTSTPGAHKEPPDSGTEAIGPKTIRIGASEEVTSMQQYNLNMQGHKKLREWLRALIYCTQRPARADLDLILVPSCNASLDAFFHMLLNPSDPVLVEEYMYCAVCIYCYIAYWYFLISPSNSLALLSYINVCESLAI